MNLTNKQLNEFLDQYKQTLEDESASHQEDEKPIIMSEEKFNEFISMEIITYLDSYIWEILDSYLQY